MVPVRRLMRGIRRMLVVRPVAVLAALALAVAATLAAAVSLAVSVPVPVAVAPAVAVVAVAMPVPLMAWGRTSRRPGGRTRVPVAAVWLGMTVGVPVPVVAVIGARRLRRWRGRRRLGGNRRRRRRWWRRGRDRLRDRGARHVTDGAARGANDSTRDERRRHGVRRGRVERDRRSRHGRRGPASSRQRRNWHGHGPRRAVGVARGNRGWGRRDRLALADHERRQLHRSQNGSSERQPHHDDCENSAQFLPFVCRFTLAWYRRDRPKTP